MKATRLEGHATIWLVDGNSFQCNRPGCNYVRSTDKDLTGDACPKCVTDWHGESGRLERRQHQIDTAAFRGVGACSCEAFNFGWKIQPQRNPAEFRDANNYVPTLPPPQETAGRPFLSRLAPVTLDALPQDVREANRCHHIKVARIEQGRGDALDALLMALPNQEQQT